MASYATAAVNVVKLAPTWLLRAILALMILNLILTAGVIYGGVKLESVASNNHQLRVGAYEACLVGNQRADRNKQLWDYIVPFLPPADRFTVGIVKLLPQINQHLPCRHP